MFDPSSFCFGRKKPTAFRFPPGGGKLQIRWLLPPLQPQTHFVGLRGWETGERERAPFCFRGFRKSRENCISVGSFFLSKLKPPRSRRWLCRPTDAACPCGCSAGSRFGSCSGPDSQPLKPLPFPVSKSPETENRLRAQAVEKVRWTFSTA